MKKTCKFLTLLIISLFTLNYVLVCSAQVIENNGFETGDITGWTISGGNSSNHTITEGGYNSTYSYKISSESGELYAYAPVDAYENQNYRVTAMVKVENLSENSYTQISLWRNTGFAVNTNLMNESVKLMSPGDWKKVTFTALTSNQIWENKAYVKLTLNGGGTVYFDNITVENERNFLENSDFSLTDPNSGSIVGWQVANGSFGDNIKIENEALTMDFVGSTTTAYVYQNVMLEAGKRYKLSFDFQIDQSTNSNAFAPLVILDPTYVYGGSTKFLTRIYASNKLQYPWNYSLKSYEFYFTAEAPQDPIVNLKFGVWLQARANSKIYYDNVKLEQAVDSLTIKTGGVDAQYVVEGDYDITYTHFAEDYSKATEVFAYAVLYDSSSGTKQIVDLKLQKAIPAATTGREFVAGEKPVVLELGLNVPDLNQGNYCIGVFCWDKVSGLNNLSKAVKLYEE